MKNKKLVLPFIMSKYFLFSSETNSNKWQRFYKLFSNRENLHLTFRKNFLIFFFLGWGGDLFLANWLGLGPPAPNVGTLLSRAEGKSEEQESGCPRTNRKGFSERLFRMSKI